VTLLLLLLLFTCQLSVLPSNQQCQSSECKMNLAVWI